MTCQLSPLSPTSYYFASYLPTLLFQPTAFPEMNQQLLFRAVELIGESLTCFEKWIDLHNQLHCVGCCQQNFGEMSASWQKKNCGERRQRTKRSLTGLYRNFVQDKKIKILHRLVWLFALFYKTTAPHFWRPSMEAVEHRCNGFHLAVDETSWLLMFWQMVVLVSRGWIILCQLVFRKLWKS